MSACSIFVRPPYVIHFFNEANAASTILKLVVARHLLSVSFVFSLFGGQTDPQFSKIYIR